jgi:LPS export ABC transporter protein LptC
MNRNSLIVGVPLLLIAVALVVWLQGLDRGNATAARDEGPRPRYSMRNAEWTRLGADGHTEFHVTAATIDYYVDESARMSNMTLDGLDGGRGPWRLTSPAGEMPAHETRMLLKKPVVMIGLPKQGGSAVKLTTDQMWVDSKLKELYTESPVRMTRGTEHASATGMRADWAGQKMDLLHDVKVTYVPPM